MSVYTAGILKPTLTSPSIPDIMPVSAALPIMGIALWCVWSVHAAESSKRATCATDCPEMATPAADTSESVTLATEISETATPVTNSSEMVVNAVEIPEIAALATDASEMAALPTELSERPAQAVEIPERAVLAAECSEKAANAADPLGWLVHASTPFAVVSSIHELFVYPVSTRDSDDELSARSVAINDSKDELSTCPVLSNDLDFDISECPMSVNPVHAKETIFEPSVCPVAVKETVHELSPCSEPAVSKFSAWSITEAIKELSAVPMTAKEAGCEFPSQMIIPELCESLVPALGAINRLSRFYVLVSLRSRSLLWLPDTSWSALATLWRSPVPPDPPWWLSNMLWWSSAPPAPPWLSPATLWWSPVPPDPPWWLSTMLWWSPVPLWFYASLALPQSPGPLSQHEQGLPTLHGPGLPSRPCSAFVPLFTCTVSWGASGSRSLGRGYVTVRLWAHHQRPPNTYTPHGLYLGLHFPSCSLITPSPVSNNRDTI